MKLSARNSASSPRSRSGCGRRGSSTRMDPDKERDMEGNHAADHGRRNFLQLAACGVGVIALAAGPARARAQTTTASPLKIGMVGAGRMGGALGALFVKAGHPVMFSSRHPENLKALATRLGPLAQAGTVEQAVAFGDVVAMVVPYAALEEIGKAHGRALATKALVMDVCNPIARRDGDDLVKWVGEQGGAGLVSAKLLPGTRIVRAFNGISYRRVAEIAHRPGGPVGVRSPATIRRPSPSPRGSSAGSGSNLSSSAASPWASTCSPVRRWLRNTRPRKFDRSPAACAESRPGMAEAQRGRGGRWHPVVRQNSSAVQSLMLLPRLGENLVR